MAHAAIARLTLAMAIAWSLDHWIPVALSLAFGVYLRGFLRLRKRRHPRVLGFHALAFAGGIATLSLALASPIHELGERLLQVHMAQHLLLMLVAPPLLWLGQPLAPMLVGLPRVLAQAATRTLSRATVRRLGRTFAHPIVAWFAFAAATWGWHMSAPYELALRSEAWHYLEHACFLTSALLFWWNVIEPWPCRPVWPRWFALPYLALADIQNTALCALLTFSDRIWYPTYAALPRPFGFSPLQDQAAAGALMWVPGSLVFLIAAVCVARQLLVGRHARWRGSGTIPTVGAALEVTPDGLGSGIVG